MKTTAFCELPFTKIKVNSEGDVSSCCWQYYSTLGNVLKQPFDEIWNGVVAKQIREQTSAGKLHTLCNVLHCPYKFKDISKEMHEFNHIEYPTDIEIDLPNTHCNIGSAIPSKEDPACIMCPRSSYNFKPHKDLLNKVLKRIKFLMPYLKHIHIQGIAEPFFKERFFEVVDILEFKKYSKQCRLSIITNATLFSQKIRDRFRELCPWTDVIFSVDAATSETYQKVRVIDALDFVKNNIKSFCSERNKETQKVKITNNINVLNVHEVEQMVELASWCGADYVEFNATDPVNGPIDSLLVNSSNAITFQNAQEKAITKAKELNIPIIFVKSLYPQLVNIT